MNDTSAFGTFGRYTETPLKEMTPEQRSAYEVTMQARGMVPGPYKIWLQNSDLAKIMVPLGAYYQGHSSLTKPEIEIATNVINAKWLAAYSNYEHEIIAERAGLHPDQVQAIISGRPTTFDDPRQQVVYEMALTVTGPRVVATGLYQRAVDLLGHAGLTDLTVLLGYFCCVSFTLMAYEVPSDAVGLDQ